jgi:alpha-galactosidase
VTVYTTFKNESETPVTLEMLSSFELGNLTPFEPDDAPDTLLLHRLRSKWSHEGRLHTETIEDLQLEPSWSSWSVSSERFGQLGSMPVKKFFPFIAVEDKKHHVLWGAQLAHEASWQMEAYRQDDCLHISGGLADREFGHWMKELKQGEELVTPYAILSVCEGDIDLLCHRLTEAGQRYVDAGPASEQELPVLFNEYCTTWGCPSHENICGILKAIDKKGFDYFVIDCGWFKAEGVPWDISMGDYEVSSALFPEGLDKTVAQIRAYGMKPGIWFEIDNVGRAAKAYDTTEHMLKRDGYPITTQSRRFWDMTDPWVQNYLGERVIGTLKEYGFEYMKMDYNDTIGIGCDGAESLGEKLRQNMDASVAFVRRVKEEVPGIILENCASGGHKLEPLMMSLCSMASFSDAHETEEIPIIAANLHRAILPRQSQIWAVIRKNDSLKRIGYSIANTFLGRMCLSGDVEELTDAQWDVIERGIAFYKQAAPVIKHGFTRRVGTHITSERHPKGWQGVVRIGEQDAQDKALVVIHCFYGNYPEVIEIPLPEDCPQRIVKTYSDNAVEFTVEDGILKYKTSEDMKAAAVLLEV